jgi:acyl carrier protein
MEYLNEIKALVASVLEINEEDLGVDVDMSEIGEWDSMRYLIILSKLEEIYGVKFPQEDIFDLVSVRALSDEINKLKERR